MRATDSLYLLLKKRINEEFDDGIKFTSRNFNDIAKLCERPFNDITVRLNYLAKQKIIEACGSIPTGSGGHNIVKYKLVNKHALLLLIPDEREKETGAAKKRKDDSIINALFLNEILNNITRSRLQREKNEQRTI